MTSGDYISAFGTGIQLIGIGLIGLYLRGKLDGSSSATGSEVTTMRQNMKETSERSIRTEATLNSHLDECKRSNEALMESVNMLSHRVDQRFEALSAEISASRSRPARAKSAV